MNAWHYSAHGLLIESDRPLRYLRAESLCAGAERVRIIHGTIDTSPDPDATLHFAGAVATTSSTAFLNIPGVARFRVRGGCEIVVQEEDGAHAVTVANYLMGSVFAALLYQRGLLPLHGAGFLGPSGAILCLGDSGSGKSTLAFNLQKRGVPVLADDVIALRPDGSVVQGISRIKIIGDAHESDTRQSWKSMAVDPRTGKAVLEINTDSISPASITAIVVLEKRETEALSVRPVEPTERIPLLLRHSYRADLFRDREGEIRDFPIYAKLAAVRHFLSVTRSIDQHTEDDLVDLVLELAASSEGHDKPE